MKPDPLPCRCSRLNPEIDLRAMRCTPSRTPQALSSRQSPDSRYIVSFHLHRPLGDAALVPKSEATKSAYLAAASLERPRLPASAATKIRV